jgi:hypothetical protein
MENIMYTVFIAKAKTSINVDFDNLPEQTKDYLIRYGLKQVLNDCLSSFKYLEKDGSVTEEYKDTSPEDFQEICLGQVEVKHENLKAGIIKASGGGRVADPVERKMLDILTKHIMQSKGFKKKDAQTAAKTVELSSVEGLREKAVELLQAEAEMLGGLDIKLGE